MLGRERRRDGLHVFKTQPGDAGDNPRESSVKLSDENARRLACLPELGCLLSRFDRCAGLAAHDTVKRPRAVPQAREKMLDA